MGLAAYGDSDRFYQVFREKIVDYHAENYWIDPHMISGVWDPLHYHIKKFPDLFDIHEPMDPENPSQDYKDVAAALQRIVNEVAMDLCVWLHKTTGEKNLVITGGVGLNCTANGKIIDSCLFDNVFVPPICDDSGTSAGAAMLVSHKDRFPMVHPFLGPEYPLTPYMQFDSIKSAVQVVDPVKAAAKEIADGKVVAWYQGRMEAGPRALGHRSILADPRNPKSVEILNTKVKHREPWRPFAPSVLEERADEWFENAVPAPFMITVSKVKVSKQAEVPAIVHADQTARLQTVTRDFDAQYYDLIKEFDRITGVPIIINTSFNVKGEPIVCTPEDAIKCFKKTGIDTLIIGNNMVKK
jgi:carbamoyltransferase